MTGKLEHETPNLTPDNVGPIIDAGADLVAVVSGIYAASDPVATQRAYLAQFA